MQAQRREHRLDKVLGQDQEQTTRNFKNIEDKERNDEEDRSIWPTDKQLKTGYLNYNTTWLCSFTKLARAQVLMQCMMILPEETHAERVQHKEIKLVENKLINAAEKYRCVILLNNYFES